jgi:hypothetical protein
VWEGKTVSKKQHVPAEIVPETLESDVPTTGNGRTPVDPVERANKILAAQARWREKNKDKVQGYQKKWRSANKSKVVEAHKRYQAKHPEKVKAWHKKSQAKQRAVIAEAKAIVAAAKAAEQSSESQAV